MNDSLEVLIQQKSKHLHHLNSGKYCQLTKNYPFITKKKLLNQNNSFSNIILIGATLLKCNYILF